MKATTEKAVTRSDSITCLKTILLSKYERRHARASLGQGELISDFVLHAVADIGTVALFVAHVASGFVAGAKTMVAKPVRH